MARYHREGGLHGDRPAPASKYLLGPLYDPEPSQVFATRFQTLPPTPPASADHKGPADQDDVEQPFLRRMLSRSNSVTSKPLAPSPPRTRYPPISGLERKRSVHTANPPPSRWNQGTILSRANSVATSRPTDTMAAVGNQDRPRRRAGSLAERYPGNRSHRPLETRTQGHSAGDAGGSLPRRTVSLRERYPGDMSHRPLAVLTRQHRAADAAPHLHNHRRQQPSDTIDSLDITGPVPGVQYHHEGPFDATSKARNAKKNAPIDAVMGTNLEAIKATPAEYLQDSFVKNYPLQGTATIPPGMPDMSGRTMEYQEGADLMREDDAAGGPYRRWDHVRYRDDDLKGKGEPTFSEDQRRDRKARGKQAAAAAAAAGHGTAAWYEMQPTLFPTGQKEGGAHVRQRSVSSAADPFLDDADDYGMPGSSGVQRSNTAGKSLSQSLKRRFGSLRKKRGSEEAGY
ncbi:hypothetical protein BT67DRAFT_447942 [Trichocladium antarcticum]|uniref:Pal1 cell morphology protein n=1 Tax=Trichocladium antarcticum TaxID=1450529 RepID=A0AAN6UQ03_9PEZI|nr:hypothetical protein BT67DRAFT_447942 [Trichocladium antarcticum]